MCIIIDSCTISTVFNPKDTNHHNFQPVLKWIIEGSGKMVYGGDKYKNELSRLSRYLRIISQLKIAGKVIEVNDADVNYEQDRVSSLVTDPDFDDPHIIAIVNISGCKLVCTVDSRACKFLKDASLYKRHVNKPKLYTGIRNKNLLSPKYYSDICSPAIKSPRGLSDTLFQ